MKFFKETINNLHDTDLDYIADRVLKTPIDKRSLSSIFKYAVYKKPSIPLDVAKVFVGV